MTSAKDESSLPRLSDAAERLLQDWPDSERGALDWEQVSEHIVARVRSTEVGSTDGALLEPPLQRAADEPASDGEQKEKPAPISDEPPRLAEIARAAVAEDSEALSKMAKEGLTLAAQSRSASRSTPQPATARTVKHEGGVARKSVSGFDGPRVVSAQAPADARASSTPRSTRSTILISLASALAAAAAVTIYFSVQRPPDGPAASSAAEESTAEVRSGKAASAGRPGSAAAPQASIEASKVVRLGDLQPAEEATAEPSEALAARSAPSAKPALTLLKRDTSAASGAASTPHAKAPAAEPPMRPAAQDTALSDKPSIGALQAALGTVIPAASACLAGQQEGVKTSVTFGSDGRVQSVAFSDGELGAGAKTCIRNALAGARVAPFAQPSFGVSITIRPP